MSATFSFDQLSRLPRTIRLQTGARLRRFRRPAVFWLITIGLAMLTANLVSRAAQPLPDQWGPSTRVVVLHRSVGPGQVLVAGDVSVEMVPAAFVPQRYARSIDEAVGRRVDPATRVGSPINLSTATPASTSELSSAIGRGRRGIAVSIDTAPAGLTSDDVVDVVVNQDGDGTILTTITGARVAQVNDRQVLLSTLPGDAGRLAAALTHGRATLILVGG
jgi:Flp pilus assembly protein CpaB